MAVIKPFKGIRPPQSMVEEVASRPYHLGASLKDLGKKLFAFSKMSLPPSTIL